MERFFQGTRVEVAHDAGQVLTLEGEPYSLGRALTNTSEQVVNSENLRTNQLQGSDCGLKVRA